MGTLGCKVLVPPASAVCGQLDVLFSHALCLKSNFNLLSLYNNIYFGYIQARLSCYPDHSVEIFKFKVLRCGRDETALLMSWPVWLFPHNGSISYCH